MPTIDVVQGLRFRVEGYIGPGCFFFFCGPFLLVPRIIGFWKIFCCRPRVCKVFFFCCAPLGAANFRRGQSKKKNTTQGVFFCSGPARTLTHSLRAWVAMPPPRRGGVFLLLRPRPDRGGVFFFAVAPPGRSLTHCGLGRFRQGPGGVFFLLRPRRVFLDNNNKCLGYYIGSKKTRRGHSKKKKHPGWCFFFALAPCRRPTGLLLPLPFPGPEQKKNTLGGVFFFALAPCRLPTGLLLPLPFAGAAAKKKTPWVVFFFLLWPRAGAQRGFSFPCLSPGPEQKKKTPWVVFFFLLRPRADAHSLTAGLGGDASPSAGWCFSFAAAPPGPGWCFFFLLWPRPDAHSLTVGWGDFGKARVVFCFCCGPAGSF